ncbi:uncharacterized protein LY89DRAFT_730066 [Mollisia scopiformis]|uniref:2EXR domain-containing protein n=1 Tax=Mollisia scopiformis TaxID=149040 RepID=A0A194XMG1_MOLSC|nr:uncharacterized protein LY89DRAFT_730066 [Mollisia scopiformis]KUJ21279.1 hypothetical protein LY89DRAFT_730066 [Mollisia scopiformis]
MPRDTSMAETALSSTFKYFPKLPIELRLIIWKYASQHQRVIRVRALKVRSEIPVVRFISQPNALLANKEAFQEMMKNYTTYSNRMFMKPLMINLEVDLLYFEDEEDLRVLIYGGRDPLREVLVNMAVSRKAMWYLTGTLWSISKFTVLERLILQTANDFSSSVDRLNQRSLECFWSNCGPAFQRPALEWISTEEMENL